MDELHRSKKLYPLLSPAHVMAYFCHIHTLRDGNKRCQNSCENRIEENLGYYVGGRDPPVEPLNQALFGFRQEKRSVHHGRPHDQQPTSAPSVS